jgi:hypothetical protein
MRSVQVSAEAQLDSAFQLLDQGDYASAHRSFLDACKRLHECRDVRAATRKKVLLFKERASDCSVQARLNAMVLDTARRAVCTEHVGAQRILLAGYRRAEDMWSQGEFDKCKRELEASLRRFDNKLATWNLDPDQAPEPVLVTRGGSEMQVCPFVFNLFASCVSKSQR